VAVEVPMLTLVVVDAALIWAMLSAAAVMAAIAVVVADEDASVDIIVPLIN
jgi:hypothetical protein